MSPPRSSTAPTCSRPPGSTAPPTTWDEFKADAEKLTDPAKKQYGIAMFAPESAYYWYPWLWQAGGEVLDKNGDVAFNSEKGKEAAEFYVGLTKYAPKDYLNSNSYDGRVPSPTARSACTSPAPGSPATLADEFPKINGKWADGAPARGRGRVAARRSPVTRSSSSGAARSRTPRGSGSSTSPSRTTWPTWTYKSEGSTLLPPRKSLLESPDLVKAKPILKGFADAMKCGVSNIIADPDWGRMEESLNTELGKAMYGDQTAAQALDNAAQDANG